MVTHILVEIADDVVTLCLTAKVQLMCINKANNSIALNTTCVNTYWHTLTITTAYACQPERANHACT